jgi:hypothetical protein
MLDRLVRRPVFAEPDRIMGHHIDDAGAHKRRQPDRRAAIIGKGQKRAAIEDQPAMHGNAVHRGRHAMLAHAIMDVAAGEVAGADLLQILGLGIVRRGQIGRAADQFGQDLGQSVQYRARGLPCRDVGAGLAKAIAQRADGIVETGGELTALASHELPAKIGRQRLQPCLPSFA